MNVADVRAMLEARWDDDLVPRLVDYVRVPAKSPMFDANWAGRGELAAVIEEARRTVYCASKHAVEGFTKSLAWELGPRGIRVNSICPTFIETEMTRPMLADAGFLDSVVSKIALGRVGRVDEIMGAVVFLASDASSLVTGSALMVDGGWTAA